MKYLSIYSQTSLHCATKGLCNKEHMKLKGENYLIWDVPISALLKKNPINRLVVNTAKRGDAIDL